MAISCRSYVVLRSTAGEQFRVLYMTGWGIPNQLYWLGLSAIAKPLGLVCRMIGFCGLRWWRIGALAKAFLSFHNGSSSSRVNSHFHKHCIFRKVEIGTVINANFWMNLRYKLVKPRSTYTWWTDYCDGQSSIVDMRFNSLPIASELMTYHKKPTPRIPNCHI